MALLTNWLNADLFSVLRDKVNAIVSAVNNFGGGTVNQIWTKDSSTDFIGTYKDKITSFISITGFNTGWTGSGGTISLSLMGDVEINANFAISAGGTVAVVTLPAAYRPITLKRFIIADYNGTDGASSIMICTINGSGDMTINKQADGTKPANRTTLTFTLRYSVLA